MSFRILVFLFTLWTTTLDAQNFCDRAGFSNGWMLNMNTAEVNQITQACAATNARYFRTDFAWSDVQYNGPNSWYWGNVDRVVNSTLPTGMEMIAIVDYFPPWANVNTDTTFWYNFVYQAGMRYIPQGIVIWEMWNEPNITNFWDQPNVADYVNKILIPGSNAIRKASADLGIPVTVLTAGLAPAATDGTNISQIDFFTGIYTNGGKDYFDGAGHHPYCWPLAPTAPNFYNWFLKTQDLRAVMVANGDQSKKIWGTEAGWPTHNGSSGVSEALQAQYLEDAYQLWNSWSWTGPLIWYAYNDGGTDPNYSEHNFGIVDNNFNPKPALAAFNAVTSSCDCLPTDLDLDVKVLLEGTYSPSLSKMSTDLNVRKLLPGQVPLDTMITPTPAGQPYSSLPWNYLGTEGTEFSNVSYDSNIVDWVLISLRTGTSKSSVVYRLASLLKSDGTLVSLQNCPVKTTLNGPFYIVVEHRNHLAAMSPITILPANGMLTYDFTTQNSYGGGVSAGQKELTPGVWGLFAGDMDQKSDINGHEITGQDITIWNLVNGIFNKYHPSDINLNGDSNGNDKAIWRLNNGNFSSIPK